MVKNGHCEERSDEAIFLSMGLPRRADALLAMTDNTRFNVDRPLETVGCFFAKSEYFVDKIEK